MRRNLGIAVVSLGCSALFACATASVGPVPGPDEEVDDPGVTAPPPVPSVGSDPTLPAAEYEVPETRYDGTYEVTTELDLAASGMLGDTVGGTLVLLSNFHDDPAGTLIGLLVLYDVPIITQVYDLLPGALEDELEGWLNDAVFDSLFAGLPAVEGVVDLIDDLASITRNVEMKTELVLGHPGAGGGMEGHHELSSFGFTYSGFTARIPVPDFAADLTAADPHARMLVVDSPNPAAPQALLEIDRHAFGIPYGEMMFSAIQDFIYAPLGVTSLGELLNRWIPCAGIASAVGDHCIWGACVNDFVSESEIASVCTDGLNLLGALVEDQIRSLRIDLLDFDMGRCEMYDVGYSDASGDFVIDALADGNWVTHVTMNGQSYTLESPFEAQRIAE
jgi:hypothetical protein